MYINLEISWTCNYVSTYNQNVKCVCVYIYTLYIHTIHFVIRQSTCQSCISRLHLTPQCQYRVNHAFWQIVSAHVSRSSPDTKCMLAHVINTNKVIIVRMPLRNPTKCLGVSGSWRGSTKSDHRRTKSPGIGIKKSHPRPRYPRSSHTKKTWHVQQSNQLSPWKQSKDPSKPASALLL